MPKGAHSNHARGCNNGAYVHGEVRHVGGKRIPTPEYRAWQSMRNRCFNKKSIDYLYYGGRGITIDQRWGKYLTFLRDMGRKPTTKHTLERKDGSKPYNKSNCCWATRSVQARNRAYVKLSMREACKISKLYATGWYTQVELAERFSVSQSIISQIVRGKAWREGG